MIIGNLFLEFNTYDIFNQIVYQNFIYITYTYNSITKEDLKYFSEQKTKLYT